MKRILSIGLALMMVLSLAACGSKSDDGKETPTEVDMTAQEIMDTLKAELGDSFACDTVDEEGRISGYYGLDMEQVESWAAMSHSNSAVNLSTAVIVQARDGYAADAAAKLQAGYEQILDYARMYDTDLPKVLQARLFVNGNYAALLILGKESDWEASEEEQAQAAADEAAKVDSAWSELLGSADNTIVIPDADSESADDTKPDDTEPDDAKPDDAKPDDTQPDDTQPDGTKPDDAKPDDTKPDDTKPDDTKPDDTQTELTASEVLDSIKESLGGSYTSDTVESEGRISGHYGLDLSKIDSWAAESNSMSSIKMDCAVVLNVKDGYAQDAAACLQQAFDQTVNYARMYNMDLLRVLQGRLYISGSYVALFVQGQIPDYTASMEDQAKFAADEAAKVDSAWETLFGDAGNSIVIPEESGESFDMSGGMAD